MQVKFSDTDDEAATVARVAASLAGRKLASQAVGFFVNSSGKIASVDSVPVCGAHVASVALTVVGDDAFLLLPTFSARTAFLMADVETSQ